MKFLRNFSRLFTGIIFIFSGFVKVIDPLGSAYKFTDYFVAMHLDFLNEGALVFAILMSIAELIIGIALVFNLLPKIAAWLLLLFMAFFTPLTLWLAVADPVSDCGCFGDAIILTNWQTFYKNLVILAFTIIVFWQRKLFKPAYNLFNQWALTIAFTIASFVLTLYCLYNLPIVDFRPYHIGANIQEGMQIPEEEKENVDVYESVFIYEKNGEQKEYSETELPDSTWTFVNADHKLVKKGYEPPIHDFTIEPIFVPGYSPEPENKYVNPWDLEFEFTKDGETITCDLDSLPDQSWNFKKIIYNTKLNPDNLKLYFLNEEGEEIIANIKDLPDNNSIFLDAEYIDTENENFLLKYGEDITNQVLEDESYAFFAIMTLLDEVNEKHLDKVAQISEFCKNNNYKFYCITASNLEEVSAFINYHKPNYQFYNMDPITLKTIVRSNPGLVLVKKGTVLNKWAAKNIPAPEQLHNDLTANSITKHQKAKNKYIYLTYIFGTLLFMSLFHGFYKYLKTNRYI